MIINIIKFIGYLLVTTGVLNLIFMSPVYGQCPRPQSCSIMTKISGYENVDFILTMGVGGFISLGFCGIILLGFAKIISTLEEIRDTNKKLWQIISNLCNQTSTLSNIAEIVDIKKSFRTTPLLSSKFC